MGSFLIAFFSKIMQVFLIDCLTSKIKKFTFSKYFWRKIKTTISIVSYLILISLIFYSINIISYNHKGKDDSKFIEVIDDFNKASNLTVTSLFDNPRCHADKHFFSILIRINYEDKRRPFFKYLSLEGFEKENRINNTQAIKSNEDTFSYNSNHPVLDKISKIREHSLRKFNISKETIFFKKQRNIEKFIFQMIGDHPKINDSNFPLKTITQNLSWDQKTNNNINYMQYVIIPYGKPETAVNFWLVAFTSKVPFDNICPRITLNNAFSRLESVIHDYLNAKNNLINLNL